MQMDPQRFVSALAQAAQVRGARLTVGEARGLNQAGGRVTGVKLADGSVLGCDAVILAMGAWTGQALQDWLGWSMPIEPCGLQKLHLRIAGPPLGCAVRWGGVNVVQRRDGLIHVGSRRDPAGFAAKPGPDSQEWLLERVRSILPGLNPEVAEARSGCAALTPNRVPHLGPLAGLDGAYVAVPSTDGFLLAAVIAQILTNSMLNGEQHPLMPQMLPAAHLSESK